MDFYLGAFDLNGLFIWFPVNLVYWYEFTVWLKNSVNPRISWFYQKPDDLDHNCFYKGV